MPFLKSNFSIEEKNRAMGRESFEAKALENLGGSFMVFKEADKGKKRKFLYFPEQEE